MRDFRINMHLSGNISLLIDIKKSIWYISYVESEIIQIS
jgi:hypothetical protein